VLVAIQDFRDARDEHLRQLLREFQAGIFDNAEQRYLEVRTRRQQRAAREKAAREKAAREKAARLERGTQATQTTQQSTAQVSPRPQHTSRLARGSTSPKPQHTSRTARGSTAHSARPDGQRLKFLFRRARVLAGLASVVVVSLIGLKLEYLDNQQFDGALSAWLALALWGAVIELSGVSVLDVVGRLGSSGAAPPGGARP
jgi:hypothetical protein